jgi:imidazole glycerol-phosphate synthase subunit HisH
LLCIKAFGFLVAFVILYSLLLSSVVERLIYFNLFFRAMKKIVILDYGLGNLRSVQKGLEHVGASPMISGNPEEILAADGIILPGVGAFKDAMKCLAPIKGVINEYVQSEKPMLGICLGQQVLMSSSEEGGLTDGLDLISGKVLRFPRSELKVPHIGWNNIGINQDHPLFTGIPENSFVYFVHSYYVDTAPENTLASCNYGLEFSASVVNSNGNVMGTQFHPEKSGATGLKILRNFVEMC